MGRRLTRIVWGNAGLRRMVLAFGLFSLAEWARWLAILVYAFDRGGAVEAGVVSLAQLLPAAAVAPLAANIGDRFSRERMLQLAYWSQAVTFGATAVALLANAPAGLVYGLAVVGVIAISLTRPAHASHLPGVTSEPAELTAANVASAWVEGIGVLAGPAIAGVILGVSGPGMVLALASACLAAGGALVSGVGGTESRARVASAHPSRSLLAGQVREALAGFSALSRLPGPRTVVLVLGASSLMWGAVDVLNIALAIDVMGIGAAGAGALGAALGVGGLLGAAAAASLVGRPRLRAALVAGMLLWGLPIVAIAVLPTPIAAAAMLVAAGAGRSLMEVAGRTLLQRAAPDEVLSRIFGILEGVFLGSFGLGSILVAVPIATAGPVAGLVVAGLWLPAVAVLGWRSLRSIDEGAAIPVERLALLRGIEMFAPLSPPILERLARGLVAVSVPAGATIIRQSEPGDRYYIVDEGRVAFSIDGREVREAGPGEGFGEIALLRDVPRTATVAAVTDARLLTLDRAPFLDAVVGHAASRRAADELVAARLEA